MPGSRAPGPTAARAIGASRALVSLPPSCSLSWPMSTALEKHACAACGAQAEWNPAKQRLVCPFCGTEAPYDVDAATGAIEEIDLVRTLREMPEDLRGWQAEKRSVQCRSCKAVMVFDAARVGQNCEFCGSPALVDYQEIKAPIRPQSLLPFKVSEPQVRENIRRWYASKWFAPNRFKSRRSSTRCTASTSRTGRSTRTSTARGGPRPGTTTTSTETYRDNNGRTADAPGAARALGAGRRRRGSLLRRRAGAGHAGIDAGLLRRWSRFRRPISSPTTPRFSRASSSSTTRWC